MANRNYFLTEEQRLAAVSRYRNGETGIAIAADMGLAWSTVYRLLRRFGVATRSAEEIKALHPTQVGKACSKCRTHYADVEHHFNLQRGKRRSICRACDAAYKARARAAKGQKTRAEIVAARRNVCFTCNASFEVLEGNFHQRRNGTWASSCKACVRARDRARYESRKEQRKAYLATYNEANRERLLEEKRRWYAENRETVAPRMRETARRWREENPQRSRTARLNYIARKKNAPGKHSAEDVRRQYAAQEGKCRWCGVEVGETYHVDHVIPLSRGGSNGPENICIACPTCNCRKNDKMPDEFLTA